MPYSSSKFHYYAIYKPYGMLSQFTSPNPDIPTLKDLYNFPKDVYSIGRLDKNSEGLLLLTNDNNFKNKILDPLHKSPKTYYVQVDGEISPEACQKLASGTIIIKHQKKRHKVAKAECKKIAPPELPPRTPPIRYRKNIPTSWISLTLKEGKNRQVRKMTAAVGFPTLRLVRKSIGKFQLRTLQPGEVTSILPEEV